jgi:hypothetical protein
VWESEKIKALNEIASLCINLEINIVCVGTAFQCVNLIKLIGWKVVCDYVECFIREIYLYVDDDDDTKQVRDVLYSRWTTTTELYTHRTCLFQLINQIKLRMKNLPVINRIFIFGVEFYADFWGFYISLSFSGGVYNNKWWW